MINDKLQSLYSSLELSRNKAQEYTDTEMTIGSGIDAIDISNDENNLEKQLRLYEQSRLEEQGGVR